MSLDDEMLRNLVAEQAAEWHVAYSEGSLDAQGMREFMRWLRTSPVHVAEYLTIAGIAHGMSNTARESTLSWDSLLAEQGASVRWIRGNGQTGSCPVQMLSPRAHRARFPHNARPCRRQGRPVVRWTAAVALSTLVVVLSLAGWHSFAQKPTTENFVTRHGEERSVRLQDDTLVQLDSDSAITVRFDHDNRKVILDRGQAYFKVAKDPGRPFSVRVGESLIRDIGTAFDVYRRPSDTTVTVAEGHIQIWNLSRPMMKSRHWLSWMEPGEKFSGEPVANLGAGQQVLITNTGQVTSLGRADVQQTLAWRQGRIAFDNEAVASVAAEFNRYNNRQISVMDPKIGARRISGMFDSHDVPTFVAFLRGLPGVRIDTHGQHIVVSASRKAKRHRD